MNTDKISALVTLLRGLTRGELAAVIGQLRLTKKKPEPKPAKLARRSTELEEIRRNIGWIESEGGIDCVTQQRWIPRP